MARSDVVPTEPRDGPQHEGRGAEREREGGESEAPASGLVPHPLERERREREGGPAREREAGHREPTAVGCTAPGRDRASPVASAPHGSSAVSTPSASGASSTRARRRVVSDARRGPRPSDIGADVDDTPREGARDARKERNAATPSAAASDQLNSACTTRSGSATDTP